MSVILVHPPNTFYGFPPQGKDRITSEPPLGLLYLAASLEREGISVEVVDVLASKMSLKETIGYIKKKNPVIVGISAVLYQSQAAVQLAKGLREEFGSSLIIGLGGVHLSTDPEFINRFPYFDFGVIGEGDITLPKIVKEILGGKKVNKIYRGEIPYNLDELPFPARHLIDKRAYFDPGGEVAYMITHRGCPFNCLFCSAVALDRRVRFRSAKNVVDEMEQLRNDYGRFFAFWDDTFTVNKKKTYELCEEIIKCKLDVEWWCQTRVDLVDRALLETMYRAGCRKISFGIETGNESIRRQVLNKNFTNSQVLDAFKACKEINISTEAFFMFGFIGETIAQMNETIEFSRKIGADMIGIHLTECLPGSDLFPLAISDGTIKRDVYDKYAMGEIDEGTFKDQIVYVPQGLSLEQLRKIHRKAYIRFYLRPNYVFRKIIRDITSWRRLKFDIQSAIMLLSHGRIKRARISTTHPAMERIFLKG